MNSAPFTCGVKKKNQCFAQPHQVEMTYIFANLNLVIKKGFIIAAYMHICEWSKNKRTQVHLIDKI